MRVISGAMRGRQLHTPRSLIFRPTTDRVKESLFNILSNRVVWEGLLCCDLYAGSGSLGIEALSRGAELVDFVECHRTSISVLEKNLASINPGSFHIHSGRVASFLQTANRRYDVIFADPPYDLDEYGMLFQLIGKRQLLREEGILVVEHRGKQVIAAPPSWKVLQTRSYGTTALTFYAYHHKEQI
jgi:16S rRNA (guanine966-N2)-methyltransferase